MPWFIVQCERKTLTKYLVKAENATAVMDVCDDWKYLGYMDGDDGRIHRWPIRRKRERLGGLRDVCRGITLHALTIL